MHSFQIDYERRDSGKEQTFLGKLNALETVLREELKKVEDLLGKEWSASEVDLSRFQEIVKGIAQKIEQIIEEAKAHEDLEQLKTEMNEVRIEINNAIAEFQPRGEENSEKQMMEEPGQFSDPVLKFLRKAEETIGEVEEAVS